jgi:Concanavalin A-like lectin/glucanases superfamily
VLRYDTVGARAAFSLRFSDLGHNGGLNAALPGARFLVNTEHGPVSAAANRRPESGWHHLAGVYDGRAIKLYIDGELVGSQSARGRIVCPGVPLTIGQLGGGWGPIRRHDRRRARIGRRAQRRMDPHDVRDPPRPDGLLPADRMTLARVSVTGQ